MERRINLSPPQYQVNTISNNSLVNSNQTQRYHPMNIEDPPPAYVTLYPPSYSSLKLTKNDI